MICWVLIKFKSPGIVRKTSSILEKEERQFIYKGTRNGLLQTFVGDKGKKDYERK